MFFWETVMKMGIFWGVAEGYSRQHSFFMRESERESDFVRWVWLEDIWRHLYLSSLSFLSHSFFLSFLFFFYINFGPAGPLKRERVGWCGLFLCFLIGRWGCVEFPCFFSFFVFVVGLCVREIKIQSLERESWWGWKI